MSAAPERGGEAMTPPPYFADGTGGRCDLRRQGPRVGKHKQGAGPFFTVGMVEWLDDGHPSPKRI